MTAQVTEIADGIFRLSVLVPEMGPPDGFTFNSFLILGEEPLLFHAGQRGMFPAFSSAVALIMPIEPLPTRRSPTARRRAWSRSTILPIALLVRSMTAS